MAFEKKVPDWNAEGTEPPSSLKNSGFSSGYKPPAAYFNWFWHGVSACLKELQEVVIKKSGDTVTGTLILSKNTDAAGDSYNSPALVVGGEPTESHIEIDNNEIQAKSNETTTGNLFLNSDGGKVAVGSGGIEMKSGASINPEEALMNAIGSSDLPWNAIFSRYLNIYGASGSQYGRFRVATTGTTSTEGITAVELGNGTAKGNANNASGKITMYGSGTGFTNILPSTRTSGSNSVKLPTETGVIALSTENGTVTSGNADYAEVGEWADGNPSDENRIGYFVAVDPSTAGTTMVKAKSTMDVRGVTVSSPAFSGGASADKFDADGNLLKQYDYVAVMGLVSVIDNGTCTINGRCMPNDSGIAVPSSNNLGYQVIDRIDSNHILIAVEPSADMVQRIRTDVAELQEHASDKSNPHGVTKAQVGLGNVDNTSDANKPVSTAQATAIADAKKAGTDAQSNLTTHAADTTKHITESERNAWNAKQAALTGTAGQVVGFDADGKPVAQDAPSSGVEMVLLWENASPTSYFVAQTITVDAEPYDEFVIEIRHNINRVDGIQYHVQKSGGRMWFYTAGINGESIYSPSVHTRDTTFSGNSFVFGDQMEFTINSSTATIGNKYLIPFRIYGMKGGATI